MNLNNSSKQEERKIPISLEVGQPNFVFLFLEKNNKINFTDQIRKKINKKKISNYNFLFSFFMLRKCLILFNMLNNGKYF